MSLPSASEIRVQIAALGGGSDRGLVQLARCGRHLTAERELVDFAATGEVDLRSSRDFIRSLRHSIVLALSDDPEARAQAMSADEMKARATPAYEDWGTIMGRK
jgi:hypothetical protein